VNRVAPFRYLILFVLIGGFFGPIAAAQSGVAPSAEAMGVPPSESKDVQEALDFLRAVLNRANTPQPAASEDDIPPPPNPIFGDLENYLLRNSNTWYVILTKLALAAFLGLVLALVYRATFTGKRKKYKPSMMQSQILLAVGGSLIWVIVATSLVRAFGLAGMVGLIRYRTPVRDPKDNVMVFLSMGVGMSCGLNQVTVAVVATAFLTLVLFAMHTFRLGKKKKKKKEDTGLEPEPAESQN
jgi:hypothetical protein